MKRTVLIYSLCAILTTGLIGCAQRSYSTKNDPYEPFNRVIFAFNQDIDHLIYRPVTKVYRTVAPSPLRRGVGNVFDNIGELTTMPNDLLQGKVKYVFLDFWRFLINSTVGIGGLFDVASKLGLKRHYNDFGMTLAYWSGKANSPYLQIPFLGPSTFRDGLGTIFDFAMSPYPYLGSNAWRYYPQIANFINIRTELLSTDVLIDEAFDPYIFVRNAYLQHRRTTIASNNKNQNVTSSANPSRYRAQSDVPMLLAPEDKSY